MEKIDVSNWEKDVLKGIEEIFGHKVSYNKWVEMIESSPVSKIKR